VEFNGENLKIEKVKQALHLVKESLKELEEVEYVVELLGKELEEYKSLVDKESFIPKAKFVKQRIGRLIERMKYVSDESLACVVIRLSLFGDIPPTEKKSIIDYIATYIDGHIRPSDMLFKVDDSTIGIIFPLKNRADLQVILKRLDTMLLNLKAKTYSNRNILLNYKIESFFIEKDCTANSVIERCKGGKE
jgi:hypothetical protein